MKNLVSYLKINNWIRTEVVERVICSIDRGNFIENENDGYTPYLNSEVYIGFGASMLAPNIHAYVLEIFYIYLSSLSRKANIKILIIGSGTGYM
jgi:protein-L-isoaspartate O-methyltransferase